MLSSDFKEFCALLDQNEVRYLVVGGYAVAFHGHPRYTGDIDIWIEVADDNVERLLDALKQFGFGSLGFDKSTFKTPGTVVQLGYPPNRIDILTALDGVAFADAYPKRIEYHTDDLTLPVIGLDHLRINKQTLGRHQDLADLEHLGLAERG